MVLKWLKLKGMKPAQEMKEEQKPGSRPDAQMERIVKRPPLKKFKFKMK